MKHFSQSLALLAMLGSSLPCDFSNEITFNLNKENDEDALRMANFKIEQARQKRLNEKKNRRQKW